MQNADISEFTNSPGWHIVHNPQSFMYEIKSESNGTTKPGCYTNKRMAEKALYDYLAAAQKHSGKAADAKKMKQKAAPVEDNSNLASEKISARTLQLAI